MRYKINGFLLSVDLADAVKNKEVITLTQQEQEALKLFFESQDGFVDTQTLESKVWGERIVTSNSLRKLISGIRLKFGDKNSLKNIRGKGYQLSYEMVPESSSRNIRSFTKIYLGAFVATLIVCVGVLLSILSNKNETPLLPKTSIQTVFESQDYILDYAKYNDDLYVTTRNKNSSTVYKTSNRQKEVLMSADFSGAFRGIEIHSSGRTVMHVIEDKKCKIKIFDKPVEQLIDEVACNRANAFPSFEWIDENRFYVTFNVVPTAPIQPYIYNLETKRIDKVDDINFDSDNGDKFIDAFIKRYEGGVFSLRENHLDQMSLMYFKGKNRKTIYQYRSKPYSIAVSDNDLIFVGNHNELLKIALNENVLEQKIEPSIVLATQTSYIDDPLYLDNELHFTTGNTSKRVINSISGNFSYSLEKNVNDFTYTDGVLSVLGETHTGYAIEQLRDGKAFKTSYFDSLLNLRHIAYFQDDVYLAGASGIYKLIDNTPTLISELKPVELVSNGTCMIAETKDGIYQFNDSHFEKLVTQGWRAFSSEKGCLFVDKLSDEIVNVKREKIAKPTMTKLLFEHLGKIYHWHLEGNKTNITNIQTGEIVFQIDKRVLYMRLVSYENDILYLTNSDVNTAIHKLTFR